MSHLFWTATQLKIKKNWKFEKSSAFYKQNKAPKNRKMWSTKNWKSLKKSQVFFETFEIFWKEFGITYTYIETECEQHDENHISEENTNSF